MRVKVGDNWYDGVKQPVMIELTEKDKVNILNMPPNLTKYCEYPKDWKEDIEKWMDDDGWKSAPLKKRG